MSKSGRLRVVALALGTALIFATTPSAAARPSAKAEKAMRELGEAAQRRDCDAVLRIGPPLIDARGGSGLPGEMEAAVYMLVALCEADSGAKDRAYARALRGSALEHAPDDLWSLRLALETEAGRHEAAVATVEAMSQGRGAALNATPIRWMWDLHDALKEPGRKDLRRRLLAVLAGDAYDPDDEFGPADDFRLAYAAMLMEAGDRDRARALVLGLKEPWRIAEASLDPRLRVFLPGEVDLRAASQAQLAVHEEAMARYPDRLRAIVRAASNLRQLGRAGDALALLQTAAARIDDPDAFTDRKEHLSWWWNSVAAAYQKLGRIDESLEALRTGAGLSEGGAPNISQVLNLASRQVYYGRGEDALKTLALFYQDGRKGSPYGEMVLRAVRGCALAVVGRPGEAAPDLAYAKAHEKDHPGALVELSVCLGDLDGAAAALIRRFDDPENRAAALLEYSDFDDPPVKLPPDPFEARRDALEARPDVKAAIARAGGTRRFNIQAGQL